MHHFGLVSLSFAVQHEIQGLNIPCGVRIKCFKCTFNNLGLVRMVTYICPFNTMLVQTPRYPFLNAQLFYCKKPSWHSGNTTGLLNYGSQVFFFVFFFNSVLRPFQDYFSSYETGQSVGGAKTGEPREKPPGTPASGTWLVSHVARAGLEPTPDTAVR